MPLKKSVALHLGGAQAQPGIGGEIGAAGAGGENHHPALRQVTFGAAADDGLADLVHLDRRLDAGFDAKLFQRILHRQRVHDRRQHAHIVGLRAVHALGGARHAAEDIAAADDQADFEPAERAAAISAASPATVSVSMPNWPCPIKASPDSLSRILLNLGRVMRGADPPNAAAGCVLGKRFYGRLRGLPTAIMQRLCLPEHANRRTIASRRGRAWRKSSLVMTARTGPRPALSRRPWRGAGHFVWWDMHIKGGAEYGREIEQALDKSDAVVVLWSERSVASAWVRDEAAVGRDKGCLIPVLTGTRDAADRDFVSTRISTSANGKDAASRLACRNC